MTEAASSKHGRPSPKSWATWLALGVVLALLGVYVFRVVTYSKHSVHYHANFALYVNGQQDKFDNFTFYEEVAACADEEHDNPKSRTHMHGDVNHIVHVHDNAVTWAHFFANLRYTLGDSLIKTDQGLFVDDQNGKQLTFWLNGKKVDNIANRTIGNEDVLLVNYGDDSVDEIVKRYDAIPRDAGAQNQKRDPAACAGDEQVTLLQRIKYGLGLPISNH